MGPQAGPCRSRPTNFIRRFLLHVLPDGFKHIRSYGLLANRHRAAKLAACRLPPAAGCSASWPQRTTPPASWTTTVTVTSDSPAGRYTIAPSAPRVTWYASKRSCRVHFRVRRPLTMFTDLLALPSTTCPLFLRATRPGLLHPGLSAWKCLKAARFISRCPPLHWHRTIAILTSPQSRGRLTRVDRAGSSRRPFNAHRRYRPWSGLAQTVFWLPVACSPQGLFIRSGRDR